MTNNEIEIYQGKSEPKSLMLKIGKTYDLIDGTEAQIVSIRTNGTEVMVYYRYKYSKKHWYSPTRYCLCNASMASFKSKLLDLGQIDEILVKPISN